MSVLVVAPTTREAAACGGPVLVCGSGGRAGEALEAYLGEHRVELVVIAGVCGALDPSLQPGDVVVARRVIAPEKAEQTPDAALLGEARSALRAARRQFVSSTVLTVDRPVMTRREKTDLWNSSGAAIVDMETYPVVEAAARHRIPWLVLRAVVDTAAFNLPTELQDWRGDGDDEGAILRSMVRRPQHWPAYAKLAIGMMRALRALNQTLPSVSGVASAGPVAGEDASSPSRSAIQR